MESIVEQQDIDKVLELSKAYDANFQEELERLINMFQSDYRVRQYYLEERISKEIVKRLEREHILQQQSKMAAMGEMMDAVAHQWKQPLNALSMYTELLQLDHQDNKVDTTYIDQYVKDVQSQIDHMVNTLNEFRTFFRPNKKHEPFGLKRCINAVLLLVKDELMRNNIDVQVESSQELILEGIENEFKHLLLNIISNAKDAFNERETPNRKLIIRFFKRGKHITVEIEDNAGGIPDDILPNIFKPNFTTKEDGKGTGIGLYMSTQIAQKMHGDLSADNINDGAVFRLKVPS